MNERSPDVVFAYQANPYGEALGKEFQNEVAADGLDLELQQIPQTRAWASLEWVIPTGFMVWIAKSYFDAFLAEAGRDHYAALKGAIGRLRERFSQVKVTQIGSPGKVSSAQPYSLIFSVWFRRDAESNFKFLIPIDLTPEDTDAAMECFFVFLAEWYGDTLEAARREHFATARALGRTVLIAYDPESKAIEIVDPLRERRA